MFELVKITALIAVSLLAINWIKKKNCSKEVVVLVFFILSRLFFNSFHEYTFVPLFAGLSLNSLHSIFFCFLLFIFYIPAKVFFIKSNFFIFFIITFMVFSAVINSVFFKSSVSMIKWFLLAELITVFLYAFAKNGVFKVSVALSIVYLYPVIMLISSVFFGVTKASESDGSTSYVGGFLPTTVFSMIILSALIILLVNLKLANIASKYILAILGVFMLFLILINYRTTLLAGVVLLFFSLISCYWNERFGWKFSILSIFTFIFSAAFFYNYDIIVERFSDLPHVLGVAGELIASPELFTKEETKLLSGRFYIWSAYIDYVLGGPVLNQIIGYGMDSWGNIFLKYAHNTFVSFYFELGLVGVFLLSLLFLNKLKWIIYIEDKSLRQLYFGCFFSFIVLNLSTMPLWAIEGIFLFSYIFAGAFYLSTDTKMNKFQL